MMRGSKTAAFAHIRAQRGYLGLVWSLVQHGGCLGGSDGGLHNLHVLVAAKTPPQAGHKSGLRFDRHHLGPQAAKNQRIVPDIGADVKNERTRPHKLSVKFAERTVAVQVAPVFELLPKTG